MRDVADAAGLVDIIRDIVDQKLNERDQTVTCMVESVNENGTLNVFVLPDMQTVVSNIINESRYDFKPGDYALLYLIKGRASNSFVVCKYNPKQRDEGWYSSSIASSASTSTAASAASKVNDVRIVDTSIVSGKIAIINKDNLTALNDDDDVLVLFGGYAGGYDDAD